MEPENQIPESDDTVALRLAAQLVGSEEFLKVLDEAAELLLPEDVGFGLILYDQKTRSGWGWRTNAPHRREILPALKALVANLEKERVCKVCGCTEEKPCLTAGEPCYWVTNNLCSACVPKTSALIDGERKAPGQLDGRLSIQRGSFEFGDVK